MVFLNSKPQPQVGAVIGFVGPGGLGAVGGDHVEEVEIGLAVEFEGEAEGDEAVLGLLEAVEISEPFVADEETGERAERSRQGPGELESLAAAVGGEGQGFVPAPFESVPPFEGEVRGEVEMRVQLQLGTELGEAVSGAGAFDAAKGEADAAFEPGKQGVHEA